LDLAKVLLALGADINRTDSAGGTAIDHAKLSGDIPMVEFLASRGGKISSAFQTKAAVMRTIMTPLYGNGH
jgi:ankyrin repeat protein